MFGIEVAMVVEVSIDAVIAGGGVVSGDEALERDFGTA